MEQAFNNLTHKERDWVAAQIDTVSKFVDEFSLPDAGQPLTLAALDRSFAAWLCRQETDADRINEAINCVGIAFGQFLVDRLDFKWVIATDEHGSDLAVYGLPGNGDVLVYPANFVAKRWERCETNFLERSYAKIARDVQAIAEARAVKSSRKLWWKFW